MWCWTEKLKYTNIKVFLQTSVFCNLDKLFNAGLPLFKIKKSQFSFNMSTSDLHDNISQQRRWSGRRKQRQWVMGIICDNAAHHTRAEEIQSKLKVSGLTGDNSSCWSANTSLGVHCCPKCEEKTWHWKYDIWALSLCHSLTHSHTNLPKLPVTG